MALPWVKQCQGLKQTEKCQPSRSVTKSSTQLHTGATYSGWLFGQLAGFQPLTIA